MIVIMIIGVAAVRIVAIVIIGVAAVVIIRIIWISVVVPTIVVWSVVSIVVVPVGGIADGSVAAGRCDRGDERDWEDAPGHDEPRSTRKQGACQLRERLTRWES
jgi:hypothetical protein